MARAYWKGYLRLSLVSIPIELYSAARESSRPTLHQIHAPSGKRIRYQKTAPGIGPVPTDEIVKGFEVAKDEYVILEPEELDALRLESKRAIDLVQFVGQEEIDPRYYDKPYYVAPEQGDVAEEGFTVIREALYETGKAGLGQMAVHGRDYAVAIRPFGAGLLLETLRYAEEIRDSKEVFRDIPEISPNEEMLDLAQELIDRKSAPFDAKAFRSKYTDAMRELIEQKRQTGRVTAATAEDLEARGGKVIDLMEALKRSVAKDREKGGGPAARKKKSAKRATG